MENCRQQNDMLVPTQVEAQHFGHSKIFTAAAGALHSPAITQHGGLYTWALGTQVEWNEEVTEKVQVPSGTATAARQSWCPLSSPRPCCRACASSLAFVMAIISG